MALPGKTDLRKEFLARRDALDPEERKRNGSLIRQRLFQLPAWKNASNILCYVSFGSEVETHLLIQEAIRFKKKVMVPLYKPDSEDTLISELKRFGELVPGARGRLLEPAEEFRRPVEPGSIELALVPGIAFDLQGGRVGFGGGYFDRLLAKMPKAFRVGLAFSAQIVHEPLPLESHDAHVHSIVTEKEILETRRVSR